MLELVNFKILITGCLKLSTVGAFRPRSCLRSLHTPLMLRWANMVEFGSAVTKLCEAAPVKKAEQLVGCGYSSTKTGPEFSLLLKCSEKFHKTLRKSWLAPNFAESVWD